MKNVLRTSDRILPVRHASAKNEQRHRRESYFQCFHISLPSGLHHSCAVPSCCVRNCVEARQRGRGYRRASSARRWWPLRVGEQQIRSLAAHSSHNCGCVVVRLSWACFSWPIPFPLAMYGGTIPYNDSVVHKPTTRSRRAGWPDRDVGIRRATSCSTAYGLRGFPNAVWCALGLQRLDRLAT